MSSVSWKWMLLLFSTMKYLYTRHCSYICYELLHGYSYSLFYFIKNICFEMIVFAVSTNQIFIYMSILHMFTVSWDYSFFLTFLLFFKNICFEMIVFLLSLPIKYIYIHMSISYIYINYFIGLLFFFSTFFLEIHTAWWWWKCTSW